MSTEATRPALGVAMHKKIGEDVSDASPAPGALAQNPLALEEYEEEGDGDDDAQWESEAAAMASQFESLVSLAPLGGSCGGQTLTQAAGSSLRSIDRKAAKGKEHTGLTRDERATVDQVLDPRTRLLLFKLINTGTLEKINGCVSTGKEANVYHAFGELTCPWHASGGGTHAHTCTRVRALATRHALTTHIARPGPRCRRGRPGRVRVCCQGV